MPRTSLRKNPYSNRSGIDRQTPNPAAQVFNTAIALTAHSDGAMGTPNSSNHPSQSRLWIRDEPARPLDFLSLAALCDSFFPRIFLRRPKWVPKRVPIGTVTLTTYFHADAAQLSARGCASVLGVARALHFGKGFSDQSAEVWSAGSALLASQPSDRLFQEMSDGKYTRLRASRMRANRCVGNATEQYRRL